MLGAPLADVQGESSAVGHRVPRVHCEIEQHLVQLNGVGAHQRSVVVDRRLEAHPLAEDVTEQQLGLTNDVGRIEDHRIQLLELAEREQLASEVAGAPNGVEDDGDVLLALLSGDFVPQQLRVAADDGEDVVEVVRDAAASRPMASILWASCNCSSSMVRSVMSSMTAITKPSSRGAVSVTCAWTTDPSR